MLVAVSVDVECLRCGARRKAERCSDGHVEAGSCRRCGDVGWARPGDLTDAERWAIRCLPTRENTA